MLFVSPVFPKVCFEFLLGACLLLGNGCGKMRGWERSEICKKVIKSLLNVRRMWIGQDFQRTGASELLSYAADPWEEGVGKPKTTRAPAMGGV